MKQLLISFFIILFLGTVIAQVNTEISNVLDNHYSAYKQEDLDKYYSTMNLTHLSLTDLEDRKEITKILWKKTDTLRYSLNIKSTEIDSGFGFAEYILNGKIKGKNNKGEDELLSVKRQLVALLSNSSGEWKIVHVMSADAFYNLFKDFYLVTQEEIINEINEDAFNELTTLENSENELSGKESNLNSQSSEEGLFLIFGGLFAIVIFGIMGFIVLIAIVIGIYFFFIKNKVKKKEKK